MPSNAELKFYASNQYTILLGLLENERLAHPETYVSAARVVSKYRESILYTGIFEDLKPIPQFDDKNKKGKKKDE